MTCTLSNIAMAKLLESKKMTDQLAKMTDNINAIRAGIARESDVKKLTKLIEAEQRVQSSIDATVVGAFMDSAFNTNVAIKSDIINSFRGAKYYSKSALNILEAIDEVNTGKGLDEYLKLSGSKYSLKDVRNKMINGIRSDEYYRSLFDNFTKKPKKNDPILKKISSLLGKSSQSLNYYIIFSQLFNPENIIDLKSVLNGLEREFTENWGEALIDGKVLTKNIRGAETLQQLEEIAKYNLYSMKDNQEVINAFTDKLASLKTGTEGSDPLTKLYITSKEILEDIRSGKRLRTDRGFESRMRMFGYHGWEDNLEYAKRSLIDIVKGKFEELEIFGETWDISRAAEILTILGPHEIIRLTSGLGKTSEQASKIILDGLALTDDLDKVRILKIMQSGDVDELAKFIKESVSGKDFIPKNQGEALLQSIARKPIDLSKPGVFFDGNAERYNGASSSVTNIIEGRKAQYNANAIDTEYEVPLFDKLSKLTKEIAKGNVKYVYVDDSNLASRTKLIDVVNKSKFKNKVGDKVIEENIEIISGSKGLSNFSFGYHVNPDTGVGSITTRAKNADLKEELVNKMYFTDITMKSVDVPLSKTDSLGKEIKTKEFTLNYMHAGFVDFKPLWDQVDSMNKDGIVIELKNYLKLIGYEAPEGAVITASLEDLKNALYEWKHHGTNNIEGYDPQELIKGKFDALQEIKKIMKITDDGQTVNHYAVLSLMNQLEDAGFTVPLSGARELLHQYVTEGRLSKLFKQTFATSNQKKIADEEINIDDMLKDMLDESYKFLQDSSSPKTKTPRSGQGISISNGDSEQLLSIRQAKVNAPAYEGSIDFSGIGDRYFKLLEGYKKEKFAAGKRNASINEMNAIDEKFFQAIDEFEYYEIQPTYGMLFDASERPRYVTGRKFNTLKMHTLDDVTLLMDDMIESMKRDYIKKEGIAKERLKDGVSAGSMEKNGYAIKNVQGKPSIVTVDDAYKVERKKISRNSTTGAKRLDDTEWDSLSKAEKKQEYARVKEQNIQDVKVGGYVKKVLESASHRIREARFFDRYRIVTTQYGPMPEAINSVSTPGLSYNAGMSIKKVMFDKVRDRFLNSDPKKLLNVSENLDWIQDTAQEVVENGLAPLRAKGGELENLSDDEFRKMVDQFTQETQLNFDVYGHIRPIKKAEVEEVKDIYGIEEGVTRDEREPYFRASSEELPDSFLKVDNYDEMVDPKARAYAERAEKFYKEKVKREVDAISNLSDSHMKYMNAFGSFVGRGVARKNRRTDTIFRATDATADSAGIATQSIESLVSGGVILDWMPAFGTDTRAAFDYFGSNRWANIIMSDDQVLRLKDAQKQIPSLMNISDEAFAEANKRPYQNGIGGKIALDNAKYFRDVRKALGTDGLGAGPTKSREVNIAMHDMYLSFIDIATKGEKRVILRDLINFQNGLSIRSILRPMQSKSVKELAGEGRNKLNLKGDADSVLIGDEQIIKRQSDVEVEEGLSYWNDLFGADFDKSEFLALSQSWLGYKNQSEWLTHIQKFGRLIKVAPGLGPMAKYMQLLRPYLSGAKGVLGYASMLNGMRRMYDPSEIKKAGKLRHIVGFGEEILDAPGLSTITGAIREKIPFLKVRETEGVDSFAARTATSKDQEMDFFRDVKDNQAHEQLSRGDKYSYMSSLYQVGLSRFRASRLGRTIDFTTANGNNFYDFVFLGHIKDYTFYQAVRNNGFRNFNNIEEFKTFLKNGDEELVDKAVTQIKSQAERLLGDFTGTNFSSSNQLVNPYTGAKGSAVDGFFLYQDMSSYLNGWGRSRTRGFVRVLGQTANMLYQGGGIASKTARKDAIDFIMNTPEYKHYINMMVEDVLSSIRYSRTTDDDGEFTASDIIRGLQATSQVYQAVGIVGELRPFLGLMESSLGVNGNLDAGEQFIADWQGTMFSNLNVEGRALEMYNDVIKEVRGSDNFGESVRTILEKYMIDVSAGSFDYMFGKELNGGRFIVQGLYDPTRAIAGEDYNDPISAIKYDSMALGNMKAGYARDDGGIRTPFRRVNKVLGGVRGLWTNTFEKDSLDLVTLADLESDHQLMNDLFMETSTYEQVKQTGNIVLKNSETELIDDFKFYYLQSNPFVGSSQALLDKIGFYKKGELFENDFGDATKYLFDNMGEEKLTEFREKYARVQTTLSNWRDYGDSDGPSKEDVREVLDTVNDRDRQYLLLRLQDDKGATGADEIIRRGMNEELYANMEEFKGEGKYQALGAMREIANMYGQRVTETKESANQQNLNIYNRLAPVFAELAPMQTDQYITSITGRRHGSEMNEKLGWNAFKHNEEKGYWNVNWRMRGNMSQLLGIQEAFREGDFARASAEVNQLSVGAFAFGEADKVGAMYGMTRMLEMIETAQMSDNEKAYVKLLVLKNSSSIIDEDLALESLGEEGAELVDTYYQQLYKTENDIVDLGIDGVLEELESSFPTDDPLGDLLDSMKEDSAGTAKSVSDAKISKPQFDKVKQQLSKALDKNRAKYKLKKFEPVDITGRIGSYTEALKARYPMKLSATTKMPVGISKGGTAKRQDISRKIKPKSRKSIKPALI